MLRVVVGAGEAIGPVVEILTDPGRPMLPKANSMWAPWIWDIANLHRFWIWPTFRDGSGPLTLLPVAAELLLFARASR